MNGQGVAGNFLISGGAGSVVNGGAIVSPGFVQLAFTSNVFTGQATFASVGPFTGIDSEFTDLGGEVTVTGDVLGDISVRAGDLLSGAKITVGGNLVGEIVITQPAGSDGGDVVNGASITVAGSVLGTGEIRVEGQCDGRIDIGGETATGSLIDIQDGLASSGSITINAACDAENANGDIIIGPHPQSLDPFEGQITIVQYPGFFGGDLSGTITIIGCHDDAPDICIGGDIGGGGGVVLDQAGCDPMVEYACLSRQTNVCPCSVNDNCDDYNNVCTFDICLMELCSITPELHGDTSHDEGGLACGPDGVVDLDDIDAMFDAY